MSDKSMLSSSIASDNTKNIKSNCGSLYDANIQNNNKHIILPKQLTEHNDSKQQHRQI
ncbi:MAG: hypothetical protein ACTHKC_08645 [Candidatus Nitrosocosmicus sp.]